MRVALAAAVLCACAAERAPVRSCADDLGGVWGDGERRWHAIDSRRAVELHPMFDSADAPGQGASAIVLVRTPDGPTGHLLFWLTDAGGTRRVRHPARATCAADRLTIAIDLGRSPVALELTQD
jgi:hypothetical protein